MDHSDAADFAPKRLTLKQVIMLLPVTNGLTVMRLLGRIIWERARKNSLHYEYKNCRTLDIIMISTIWTP